MCWLLFALVEAHDGHVSQHGQCLFENALRRHHHVRTSRAATSSASFQKHLFSCTMKQQVCVCYTDNWLHNRQSVMECLQLRSRVLGSGRLDHIRMQIYYVNTPQGCVTSSAVFAGTFELCAYFPDTKHDVHLDAKSRATTKR